MKICVLGHSTSAGNGLPDRVLAWPWLTAGAVGDVTGDPVTVEHVMLMPMGGRAVTYALAKVDELAPDIVVVSIATYLCAIRTVGESVRRRFGQRVFTLYRRAERRFETTTGGGAPGARAMLNRRGRWLARRVLGTASFATVDDVASVFAGILRGLAQREGIFVVAFAEPPWPDRVDSENRQANRRYHQLKARVREVAADHHITWVDCEHAYAAAPDRLALYQADGVHKTVEGHRIQADPLVGALTGPSGPLTL